MPEPAKVQAETRPNPILPVTQVREHPAREAGRIAFAGITEDRKSLPAQLPLLPAPEGPRVPLLELVDRYGVPTMAHGRGAPLELAVYIGACLLPPHKAGKGRSLVVTTVRELRDFLFGPTWRPGPTGSRKPRDRRGKRGIVTCVETMPRRLTAIVEREGNGYVALCSELDVASQGETVAFEVGA